MNEPQHGDRTLLDSRAARFFWRITAFPLTAATLGAVAVVWLASYIPGLHRETDLDSFMPPDHPAVVYREHVRDVFGLSDAVVVLIARDAPDGVFTPETLELVRWLSEEIARIPGVDPDLVTSLTSEKLIRGTADGMEVEPFLDAPVRSAEDARRVRARALASEVHLGDLIARNGRATLIVAELLDQEHGAAVYRRVLELVASAPQTGAEIHVAGDGAAKGYLDEYMEYDARTLNGLASLVIVAILGVAYRTVRGVLVPLYVMIGGTVTAVGGMGLAGVSFYPISNTLSVVVIAISVADAIHILGQFYEEQARRPAAEIRELVVLAMTRMWRPVVVTSVTNVAGFISLTASSFMPPMREFGLFASLGVVAAMLLSLGVVPNLLLLGRVRPSPAFAQGGAGARVDAFGRLTGALGRFVVRRPRPVLAVGAGIAVAGALGALRLEPNEEQISYFRESEPIYQADRAINRTLNGTNFLDIVIETDAPGGILRPETLRRIEALQAHMEGVPRVSGTRSIVDFLKQMNRAMYADDPERYALPETEEAAAQYFLLYSARGAPDDFEQLVDYDYRLADVRVTLNRGRYSDIKVLVESAQAYIDEHFDAPGVRASLAGKLNVDYHWNRSITPSHFRGVALALAVVWGMAAVCFRSALAGLVSLLPVAVAVLLVYATMGFGGIWLSISTSMFAAIVIGVGVDFAVHVVDRAIVLSASRGLGDVLEGLFATTGRALLFNSAVVFFGFGVLTASRITRVVSFGFVISVAVLVSFAVSLTVVPALLRVLDPAFLHGRRPADAAPAGSAAAPGRG